MKRIFLTGLSALLALSFLTFSTCMLFLQPGTEGRTVSVSIAPGTGGRTAVPDVTKAAFSRIDVTLTSRDGYAALTVSDAVSADGWSVIFPEVREGFWDVKVDLFIGTDTVGTGSLAAQPITSDTSLSVPVTVSSPLSTGSVDLRVSFPASTGIDSLSAVLNPGSIALTADVNTASDPRTARLTGSGIGVGLYEMKLTFGAGGSAGGVYVEPVCVWGGLATDSWVSAGGTLIDVKGFAATDFFDANVSLSNLTVSDGVLPDGSFSSGTKDYVRGVPPALVSVTFTASASVAGQYLQYRWNPASPSDPFIPIASDTPSPALTLASAPGDPGSFDTLEVKVTAPDRQTESATPYTVKFGRGHYSVTYNGNAPTAGSVPADPNRYIEGAEVTILGNTGTPPLSRTGYALKEWNTSSDGMGTPCQPGNTFPMSSSDAILYAIWISGGMPSGVTGNQSGGNWVISNGSSASGSIDIPGYWNGLPVAIKNNAFDGNTSITSVSLDEGIESIGNYAFRNCRGLSGSLSIPSSVTTIGDWAFYGCSGFTGSLTIPVGVTIIGWSAFEGCSRLSGSLSIPATVTKIGNGAFEGCIGLSGSLSIPSSVATIENSAFYGCTGFTGSLTIPVGVTTIESQAFQFCTGFTGSLSIPAGVTTIGYSVFQGCIGFTGNLSIPATVTTIGFSAFRGCSGLTSVTVHRETPPITETNILLDCPALTAIHVPTAAAVTAYKGAAGWSTYSALIVSP